MKKPKRAKSSLREKLQKRREAAEEARPRELPPSADLMWGDEGVDDPPASREALENTRTTAFAALSAADRS